MQATCMSWLIDHVLLTCVTLLRAGSFQSLSFNVQSGSFYFKKGSKFKPSFDAGLKKEQEHFSVGLKPRKPRKVVTKKGIDSHA